MSYFRTVLSVLVVVTLGCSLALGQEQDRQQMHRPDSMQKGMMMQGEMMGMHGQMMERMMNHPMHRSMMMIHILPALQDTLGLSEEQAEQLEQLKQEYHTQRQQAMQERSNQHQQLQKLFEEEHPPAEEVRRLFEEMAQSRADVMATGYETSQQMREVLDEQQQEALAELGPQQMHHYMMTQMSMMDMMQMMQMMRSMNGGMEMMHGMKMKGSMEKSNGDHSPPAGGHNH